MSNDYEWLRFVDLDKNATDEEREKILHIKSPTKYIITGWIVRFQTYALRNVLFSFAVYLDYCELIRFVCDIGAKKEMSPDYGSDPFDTITNDWDVKCMLIDMGIEIYGASSFRNSRNAARLGAIVSMGAIRSRLWRERERGWKDVSRIIGRLIWASRKYYLSDESPSPSKRIKNE